MASNISTLLILFDTLSFSPLGFQLMSFQSRFILTKIPNLLSKPVSRLSLFSKHFPQSRPMASTQTPKTMKGILIEKTGGTEVLQYKTDLPVPEPKEGEVLVKNDFIGINYIDT